MHKGIIFIGMGFELLGVVLGALFIGAAIDKELGWPGYGLAACVVAALVSWVAHLVFMVKKFMDEIPDDPQD